MRKRLKKVKKSKDSEIVVSRQFDFAQKSKGDFPSRRTFEFIEGIGRNCRMQLFIAINGQDCASFGESSRLSCICLILDGVSGCVHVVRRRDGVASIRLLDLHPTIMINRDLYKSLDEPPRLNFI